MYYIGLDVGGTFIKHGLIDDQGRVMQSGKEVTPIEKEVLLTCLSDIVKTYQRQESDVKGVGISMPGVVRADGFLTTAGAHKELFGVHLKEEMEGRTGLPVCVENDANAAAIAEHWIGAARGIDNYVAMILGTGLGGAIVINGQVYRGAHGASGEFGWMVTRDFDMLEHLEDYSQNWRSAIGIGLLDQYEKASGEHLEDARELFARVDQGEVIATKILNRHYRDVSVGAINLIAAFDPEVVLIGGGITASDRYMQELKTEFDHVKANHSSLTYISQYFDTGIEAVGLGNDAGMIGAVYQVHQQLNR
jgi:predicted NBD/HSP70 family sugar kinase